MPQFSYKARRRSGEVVLGNLDVPDRAAALMQIERLGLFPVAVEGAKGAAVPKQEGAPESNRRRTAILPPALRELLQRKRRPKLQELATFTTQLANLLKSGMPLTVALNSMTHLESKGIPAEVSRNLKQEVMEGRSLSDAMAKQPRIFSDLIRQHGARGRVERRVGGSAAAHGGSFRAVRRGAVQVQIRADLSGDGLRAWAWGSSSSS